ADHRRPRRPYRPLALGADARRALPFETFAADADAVAHRLAVAEHEVEMLFAGIDDDRAGLFAGLVVDRLAAVFRGDLADRDGRHAVARIGARAVARERHAGDAVGRAAGESRRQRKSGSDEQ